MILAAIALAVEPDWIARYTVPATAGPPADECASAVAVASPTVEKPPSPTPSAEPPPPPETEGMIRWDTADPKPPEDIARRLGLPGPFEVATIPLEPLRGLPEDLARVKGVLAKAARREGVTRVAFWGASHVAGEYFTGEVRRILQDRYGDAGHGFVMPAAPWKGYRASDVNLCSGGSWTSDYHNRSGGRDDGAYGPAGISVESSAPTSFGWVQTTKTNPHGRAVSRLEVLFLRQPGGGAVDLRVDDADPVRVETGGARGPGGVVLAVEDGPHRLVVTPAGDGPVKLFGVVMEREGPGVVVDAAGVTGRTAASWLSWDASLVDPFLERRMPDLAVLAYGTNEANDRGLDEAEYRLSLRAVLGRMREAMPDAACVLVGPSDRGKKVRGTVHVVWSRTAWVARVQREVGPEFGCATWDLQEATGGPGSIFRWHEAELAAGDLIHFTAAGYRELARRFVAAVDQI
ncbi:MAG: GDSL-type esterase/lipase family protein [Myxococcota bacterium]